MTEILGALGWETSDTQCLTLKRYLGAPNLGEHVVGVPLLPSKLRQQILIER